MTVQELIAELQQIDPGVNVTVSLGSGDGHPFLVPVLSADRVQAIRAGDKDLLAISPRLPRHHVVIEQ